MGKARRERRAARGGGGEEPSEPRVSRRKQRKMQQAAEREELDSRPSGLKETNWRLRQRYNGMTISQLEALLVKFGDKEKFAENVRIINVVLKVKRKRVAALAPKTTDGEPPKSLPRRKSRLVGFVESEIYLFRTRKKK